MTCVVDVFWRKREIGGEEGGGGGEIEERERCVYV